MYVTTKIRANSAWENWGTAGALCGFSLCIIGILLQCLEIPRIYNGATNVDALTNITDGIYQMSNYNQHWWPWTYPACLFGLFTFITGVVGILAAIRGTYTSIFGFFTMSAVSAVFSIYLIVYYGFVISLYRSMGKDKPSNRTAAESVSYGLASTQMAIACLNIIISSLAAIFSGRAIALCVSKGFVEDDILPLAPRTPLPPSAYRRPDF